MPLSLKGGSGKSGRRQGRGGKGYGHVSESFIQQSISIPSKAVGLVLGKGGRNIRELQQVDGIQYVHLDTQACVVTVSGTAEAVEIVAAQVEKCINMAAVNRDLELSVTLVDIGGSATETVSLAPAKEVALPIELSDSAPGREYFALCRGKPMSLEEQMSAMTLSKGVAEADSRDKDVIGAKGRLVFSAVAEAYAAEFETLIRNLRQKQAGAHFRAEARYGILLLSCPPLGLATGRGIPQSEFARLSLHRDLLPRFFGNIKTDKIDRIKKFLIGCRFAAVPPEHRKVLHLVDMQSQKRLSVTVAEMEDGTDARLGDQSKKEIDRIAASANYFAVLGLEPACSDQDVRKAYYKLAKLVHPDKSAHPGADSAMKVVTICREALATSEKRLQYSRNPIPPPTLPRGLASPRLKVVKCHTDQCKHLVIDVLKMQDDLGARVQVRSYSDLQHDQELMSFLDKSVSGQNDSMLGACIKDRFRIDTIRHKTKERFTDGDLKIIIEHVRQQDVGQSSAHERWEVEIRSHVLKDALKSVLVMNEEDIRRLPTLFHDFVSSVSALGAEMTSSAMRMLTTNCEGCSMPQTGLVELR